MEPIQPNMSGRRKGGRLAGLKACVMLLWLAALFAATGSVQAQSREYTLKAAFLFHFTQFVDWPASSFAETNTPFVIGVLGVDPFGRALEDVVAGERVKGRGISIMRYKTLAEVEEKQPHILFISPSESARMAAILKYLQGKPVLTVSDLDQFAVKGGIIRFITENNKIRFRINNVAAQDAKLAISSKLLRLAELVSPDQ